MVAALSMSLRKMSRGEPSGKAEMLGRDGRLKSTEAARHAAFL